jgi:hypothetical protein
MTHKIPLFAALMAMFPVSGAGFTLDAAGYDGAELPHEVAAIRIVGYGEVIFEAADDTAIMVNSGYLYDTLPPNPDLDFDLRKVVKIVLNGPGKRAESLTFAGIPTAGQQEIVPAAGHDFSIPSTEADVTKPYGVPEMASAVLGLLGTAILLLRRLR